MAKKRPSKTTLNNSLDRMASLQARERAHNLCERCGAPATQVHHFYSRRFRRIRWDQRNLISICATCHRFAHDCPAAFVWWFERVRPDDYTYLMNPDNRAPINRSIGDLIDLRDEMAA
jgi:hypothetical protein